MVVQPGQRRSQLWDERSFQTSFLHDGDQYAHGNLRCSRNISFVPLCDPVCECLGQIFRPHDLVFTMISSVSYTVFQNHVASIELAQVKSKSSNICERKKKKPLCYVFCPIICATCTYSSNRHATHFQKQLQTLKRKLKKGEWTYSVVTGHYGSSWGSYGAHVQIYPLINIYEGCTHSRNSLFAAMSSPDFSPLNTSHSPPHNQLFLCLTPFNPTCL